MASITINIPDTVAQRVVDALAATGGWTADSGLTKAQFAKRQVIDYIRGRVIGYEAQVAANDANEAAKAQAEADVVLT